MCKRFQVCVVAAVLLASASSAIAQSAPTVGQPLQFQVTFDTKLQSAPYTGRVYVVLSSNTSREPRRQLTNWFAPPQVFALDLINWEPAKPILLGENAMHNPRKLRELESMEYSVQAIARRSIDHPVPGNGPGDIFSDPQKLRLDVANSGTVQLVLSNVVEASPPKETERVKYVEIDSPLLSKFHGRAMKMRAGVVLPIGWSEDSKRTYPVVYWIGGFGSDHRIPSRMPSMGRWMEAGDLSDHVLQVVPDPTCYRGHTVFADSDNNGPWGQALVQELIPYVEKKFRGAQTGQQRYVTGISSGGWSSLWLQITYPDEFAGCWAHVPDPVDFRAFQKINLYEPDANIFVDKSGQKRVVGFRRDLTTILYEDFVRMEEVLGPGGQIHSFEAVFSKRSADGTPESLFDRQTGAVNHKVAMSWERYDIRLILQRNWKELAPKLQGKLHVYAGEHDSFYLQGAVALLKESLAQLGSDAQVLTIAGMGHAIHRDALRPMYQRILDRAAFAKQAVEPTAPASE